MNTKRLVISLVLPQLAGLLGSFFTYPKTSTWYATLNKPFFNPPDFLFGPVWLLLYLMMGIAIYLIWQELKKNKKAKCAMGLFWIHLAFNASWSIFFFGLENLLLALINIVLIWLFIILLFFKFWNIKKLASYLLIPYFLWVSFATVLNYYIWFLN